MKWHQDLDQALSLLQSGDRDTARQIILQVLKTDVNHERGWFLLSYCLDKPADQVFALKQVLRIDPDNRQARELLSKISAIPASQIKKPQELVKTSFEVDSHLKDIRKLQREGRSESARGELKKLLKIHPDSSQAWYLLSQVAERELDERIYLRQTLRLDPDHRIARTRLEQLTVSAVEVIQAEPRVLSPRKERLEAFFSFGKYSVRKLVTLFLTVVVGLYITILVANMGGYVDHIFEGMVADQMMAYGFGDALREIPEDEREEHLAEVQWQLEEAMGLHTPFFIRTIRWLFNGLTLDFGESFLYYFFGGVQRGADQLVRGMIFRRLPYTLTLIGASNLLVFITSISAALVLSRKYGSWMDRISAALASLSSAPSWIFGIILVLLLAGEFMVLPFPKAIDLQYADFSPRYIRLLLTQMVMPVIAIFFSMFFQGVYAWRTFFLIYSQEDYVDMARAMGLTARKIERQYILKPTFPYVITNFAMMMITVWESSIALEVLFYWPGIGPLFLNAANSFRTNVIVGVVVIFAYLLAVTIFILDLVYALVDPRVRLGVGDQKLKTARRNINFSQRIRNGFQKTVDGFKTLVSWFGALPGMFRVPIAKRLKSFKRAGRSLRITFKEIWGYPSAILGLVIIIFLIVVSIYTIVKIPYSEVLQIWSTHHTTGSDQYWAKNPKNAAPTWTNLFRRVKLPETVQLSTTDGDVGKSYTPLGEGLTEIEVVYEFDYTYDDFPDEISLFFDSQYEEKLPHISLIWSTPDGREINLDSFSLESAFVYRLTLNEKLSRKLAGYSPNVGLFVVPDSIEPHPVKGIYRLTVSGVVFEEGSDFDCEFVLYGRVFGLAGTDNHRRDLTVALLWGTPVALAFGLFGAIGTSLIAMVISAVGVWYGGWVDGLIQRITEVNIILPTLPIAIMIFILYSRSIWTVLIVIVLLNIFGSSIKNYRAAFIQVRESAYVEGATAYGAKGGRIIINYLIPRILPVLLPQLVIMVPGYVYYEATLAYLGLSDPYLPTWGKVVHDAIMNGAYSGHYYWILEPVVLLLVTGLAFAMLGFALDRVINPRLRDL